MSLRQFVIRWELAWHLVTIAFFGAALALVVLVWPGVSNLWVSVFVLIGSFTAAMSAMIGTIKTRGDE